MRTLNFTSKLGQVVRAFQRASSQGQNVHIDYLQEKLGSSLTRKQLASYASKLYNQGYLERVGVGQYRVTENLSQLAAGSEPEEAPTESAENSGKSPAVIIRKQSRDQAEQAAKKRQEADLARLVKLVERLEGCLDRLEKATERLAYNSELQEAMDLLEQAWAKGKNICAADSDSGQSPDK